MNMRTELGVGANTMQRAEKIKGPREDRLNLQDRIDNIQRTYSSGTEWEGTLQWIKE